MSERPVKLHEEDPDGSERTMAERATLLYWNSDRSVNSIAEDLGLSKGRLYELIRPLSSGAACSNCGSDLVFSNRTARDRGDAECVECGATEDPGPLPATPDPERASRAETDSRGIVAGLLVGAAAGLLVGRFLRR